MLPSGPEAETDEQRTLVERLGQIGWVFALTHTIFWLALGTLAGSLAGLLLAASFALRRYLGEGVRGGAHSAIELDTKTIFLFTAIGALCGLIYLAIRFGQYRRAMRHHGNSLADLARMPAPERQAAIKAIDGE